MAAAPQFQAVQVYERPLESFFSFPRSCVGMHISLNLMAVTPERGNE